MNTIASSAATVSRFPPTSSATVEGHGRLRVLVVEDSDDDTDLLIRELRRGGFQPVWERVETPEAMSAALRQGSWDVVICDHGMPQFSAPGALKLLRESGLDQPFIIVSGTIGEEAAVKAMKEGASDYLTKGNLARLVPAVGRELRDALVRQERRQAQAAQRDQAQMSAALARVAADLIAALDTPALLTCLCRVTAEVLKCDMSYTLLRRPREDVLACVASHGIALDTQEAAHVLRLPLTTLSAWLPAIKCEDVVETTAVDLEVLTGQQPGVGRQLCMALRCGTKLIGVQVASCHTRTAAFSPTQLRVAHGIAQLASMTVQHQQMVAELEQANRLKSDFVATMSHELRTPLNVIMGYNQLLLDHEFGSLTPQQTATLGRMRHSSQQLLELVNATLDLNRLEAGRLPVTVQEIGAGDVMAVLQGETRELQAQTSLRLVWDVPPHLPALRTDLPKLKVILKNLIGNAVKFTDQGCVTIAARPCDRGVEFSVSDTGIGIATEDVPAIFESFRQLESSMTRRHGGVGLGLYIVHRLLDLLGGSIRVESEVGRGATFRVWLPLDASDR
jgi:signal transduction histidine kinase